MTAPKFEKQNHHYVPQFWQRSFRDSKNQLYARTGSTLRIVSPAKIMQADWLYTLFDDQWRPSDALEDAFSGIESEHARLLHRLEPPGYVPTADDETQLCAFLGVQASRHPDVLQRGLTLGREFGKILARVHDHSVEEFLTAVGLYGIIRSEGQYLYERLTSRTADQLADELTHLLKLSPQSPLFPAQDAIRAGPHIEVAIAAMQLRLLDAEPPSAFVLGDTPMPQSDLSHGFSVPLTKSLAVIACPAGTAKSAMRREVATQAEINMINRTQFANALDTVIGPSAELLRNL